jgi:2-(1,2-epoxy-1,2-dihydrophenyl)acetyl-CoA isomerase
VRSSLYERKSSNNARWKKDKYEGGIMKLETVLYKIEGNVAVISMNRESAMNSLSKQLFEELTVAFEAAKTDETVRAVVLTGEGRCFCAGGDISELIGLTTDEAVEKFLESADKLMMLLYNFPKPVIAAAHGAIAGAGTSLFLSCDIRIVAHNAKFIVAFGSVGLVADCGLHYLLPRFVGLSRAKEMMLTQRVVKRDELLELGIADQVVLVDELMATAMTLAAKIAAGPVNAYALSKELFNKYAEVDFVQMLKEEANAQKLAISHHNGKEGLKAFLEKRPAKFK